MRRVNGLPVTTIYKICEREAWQVAESDGAFRGSDVDLRDGFIHFSTAAQLAGTAAKHFAGASDLVLVAVEAECCPWAAWRVERAAGSVVLDVRSPGEGAAVLHAMFTDGRPSAS